MGVERTLRMDPEDVRTRMQQGEELLLVCAHADDARYRAIALDGAIPLSRFRSPMVSLTPRTLLVFYGDGPGDDQPERRAREYRDQGHPAVRVLRGGAEAWRAAGYPICRP